MDFGVGKQNGMIYNNDPIMTPIGRLCWVNLATKKPGFKQKDGTTGEPKFQVTLLLEKNKKNNAFVDSVIATADDMLTEYNKHCKKFGKPKLAEIISVRDGDEEDLEKYPFNENCWIIRSSNKGEINCWSQSKDVIEDKSTILGGMFGRLVIEMSLGGFGVSFRCTDVQVTGDDKTRFGGGSRDHSALITAVEGDDEETEAEEKPTKLKKKAKVFEEDDEDENNDEEDTEEDTEEDDEGEGDAEDADDDSEESEEEEAPRKRGRPAGSKKSVAEIRANALAKRKGVVADVL